MNILVFDDSMRIDVSDDLHGKVTITCTTSNGSNRDDEASQVGEPVPDFYDAFCNYCSKNWIERPDSGGFLFMGEVTCPDCAPRFESLAKQYRVTHLIEERCPANMSFADWVHSSRGGFWR